MASGEMPPNVLSLEAKKPVSVEPGGKMSYEYQAIFTNGAARQWIQGEALESNKFGRGLIRQLDKREVLAERKRDATVKMPPKPKTYLPDSTVVPALQRLRREDKLRWFGLVYAGRDDETAVARDYRCCFRVEQTMEKQTLSSLDDWPLFLAALPKEECRLAVFRFDFRATRELLLVNWSPPTSEALQFEDTKVWDMRKILLARAEKGLMDEKRVHAAENGPTPRESLVSLLLESRPSEWYRRLYAASLPGVRKFLGGITVVNCATADDVAPQVKAARETLRREAEETAREVAEAAARDAARAALSLATAYALGYRFRRFHYRDRKQVAEEAARLAAEAAEAEAEEKAKESRLAEEEKKRREYGARARDPVWRARLSSAKRGAKAELTDWWAGREEAASDASTFRPKSPGNSTWTGLRRKRLQEASQLVLGQSPAHGRGRVVGDVSYLLREAQQATQALDTTTAPTVWESERTIHFGESGPLGMRVSEDRYGRVTVSALLSEEKWDGSFAPLPALACGCVRVGDRILEVAVGKPTAKEMRGEPVLASGIVVFSGIKVTMTSILGVLAKNERPIVITFAPPKFGGWPSDPPQFAQAVTMVTLNDPLCLPTLSADPCLKADVPLPMGEEGEDGGGTGLFGTQLSAIDLNHKGPALSSEEYENESGGPPSPRSVSSVGGTGRNRRSTLGKSGNLEWDSLLEDGHATIGVGENKRPAIGIRLQPSSAMPKGAPPSKSRR